MKKETLLEYVERVLEANKEVIERPSPRLRPFYLYKCLLVVRDELKSKKKIADPKVSPK